MGTSPPLTCELKNNRTVLESLNPQTSLCRGGVAFKFHFGILGVTLSGLNATKYDGLSSCSLNLDINFLHPLLRPKITIDK